MVLLICLALCSYVLASPYDPQLSLSPQVHSINRDFVFHNSHRYIGNSADFEENAASPMRRQSPLQMLYMFIV